MGTTCVVSTRGYIAKTKNSKAQDREEVPNRIQAWPPSEPSSPLFDAPAVTTFDHQDDVQPAHRAIGGRQPVTARIMMVEAHGQTGSQSPSRSATNSTPSIDGPEHVVLRESHSTLQSEIEALEALNHKSKAELQKLFTPFAVPTSEGGTEHQEMMQLLEEIAVRNQLIRERRILAAQIERRMLRMGHPMRRPVQETCYRDEPEDPSLCNFCVSRPVTKVYSCCLYRGACSQCVRAMRNVSPNCPHCRCQNPAVVPV